MNTWQKFLDSLATRGGAIFLLFFMVMMVNIAAFVMYLKHDISVTQLATLFGAGGLLNALMLALKGGSEPGSQPPQVNVTLPGPAPVPPTTTGNAPVNGQP